MFAGFTEPTLAALEGENMLVEGTDAERLAVLQTILSALKAEGVADLVAWIDLKDPAWPGQAAEKYELLNVNAGRSGNAGGAA